MFRPVKVIDVELTQPLGDIEGLARYGALQGLVRRQQVPIGYVRVPLVAGRCQAAALRQAILDQLGQVLLQRMLHDRMAESLLLEGAGLDHLAGKLPESEEELPLVTVAVCTRDRVSALSLCLDALTGLDYNRLDLLVIDNAPSDGATERLVRDDYPSVRYVREPRPGLDWARNRAIVEARGEIIAFTDDDVAVDSRWAAALAQVFHESPEVMAVTGLVVPYELETEAQLLFERFYGFGKGFERKRHHLPPDTNRTEKFHVRAGRFGTGANMAFRRSLFDKIGGFDPALDVGTVTNGGGDLEMFFRVIQEGFTLVYEPNAIVRHRHRRTHEELRKQMTDWGIGTYSYLTRSARAYPAMRFAIIRFALKWLWKGNLRRALINRFRPGGAPYDLVWAQLRGSLLGLFRYQKASHMATEIAENFESINNTNASHEQLPMASCRYTIVN